MKVSTKEKREKEKIKKQLSDFLDLLCKCENLKNKNFIFKCNVFI